MFSENQIEAISEVFEKEIYKTSDSSWEEGLEIDSIFLDGSWYSVPIRTIDFSE